MNTQTLYLIRGLPGSGKTTLAHRIAQIVHSADDYFVDQHDVYRYDVYRYDVSKIKDAHESCQAAVATSLASGYRHVAVANTFSRRWEMSAYHTMMPAGRKPHIIELTVNVMATNAELAGRCVRCVPIETIAEMRRRWEA